MLHFSEVAKYLKSLTRSYVMEGQVGIIYTCPKTMPLQMLVLKDWHLWLISYFLSVIDTTQTIMSQQPPFAIYAVGKWTNLACELCISC